MTRRHRDLSTRDDLIAWLRGLLPDPYAYPATSGSTYDEDVRRFEWVARPLWSVFSLLASGEYDEALVEPYIRRVKDGLDPEGPLAFPEPTLPRRQIIVEMEVFGYGLLVCPEGLLSLPPRSVTAWSPGLTSPTGWTFRGAAGSALARS